MTKYAIVKSKFQFAFEGRAPSMAGGDIVAKAFNSREDAETVFVSADLPAVLEEFRTNYSGFGTTEVKRGSGKSVLTGECAWVEERVYDDRGEFPPVGPLARAACDYIYSSDPPRKKRWDAENVRIFTFKLFLGTDKDVYEYLKDRNKRNTIKLAIRFLMAHEEQARKEFGEAK